MKFFSLFSRRSTPLPPSDPEDWSVGDLAECLSDQPWFYAATGAPAPVSPKAGARYRVTAVMLQPYGTFLRLSGIDRVACDFRGFRKVRPRADELRAADAAFAQRLRTTPPDLPPAQPRELEETA